MALSASDVSQFKELATADGAKAQTMLGEIKVFSMRVCNPPVTDSV